MPNLEDIAPKLAGARVFSTLNAVGGFYQIPPSTESMTLTKCFTPFGRFCFTRIPMGITLGPEAFQKKMNEMLQGLDGCDAVMDDILIWVETIKNITDVLTKY